MTTLALRGRFRRARLADDRYAGSPVNTLSREAITELETLVSAVEDLVASGEVIGW